MLSRCEFQQQPGCGDWAVKYLVEIAAFKASATAERSRCSWLMPVA